MIVEGQIHGGVAQGVGGALYERMAYDESGQLLNASFMDFLMPYVTEVPGEHRHRPPRDAVAAEPARDQGRRRGGRDPVGGGVRLRDRGCRARRTAWVLDHGDADLAVGAVRAPPGFRAWPESGVRMKISGREAIPFPVETGLGRPARPRRARADDPGLRAARDVSSSGAGEQAYAMTVTAGVAAIRGTYDGTCALSDLKQHESLVMRLQGAGAPGTIDATVQVSFQAVRRPDGGRVRRRRGRRRHGRRGRPADARLGLEADGR